MDECRLIASELKRLRQNRLRHVGVLLTVPGVRWRRSSHNVKQTWVLFRRRSRRGRLSLAGLHKRRNRLTLRVKAGRAETWRTRASSHRRVYLMCVCVCFWSILRPVLRPADTSGLFSVPHTTANHSWADCTSGNLSTRVSCIYSIERCVCVWFFNVFRKYSIIYTNVEEVQFYFYVSDLVMKIERIAVEATRVQTRAKRRKEDNLVRYRHKQAGETWIWTRRQGPRNEAELNKWLTRKRKTNWGGSAKIKSTVSKVEGKIQRQGVWSVKTTRGTSGLGKNKQAWRFWTDQESGQAGCCWWTGQSDERVRNSN